METDPSPVLPPRHAEDPAFDLRDRLLGGGERGREIAREDTHPFRLTGQRKRDVHVEPAPDGLVDVFAIVRGRDQKSAVLLDALEQRVDFFVARIVGRLLASTPLAPPPEDSAMCTPFARNGRAFIAAALMTWVPEPGVLVI